MLLLSFYSVQKSSAVTLDRDNDYSKVLFKGSEIQTCTAEEADYEYKLPKFRLANSSLSLLFTTIKSGSSRPCHSHKGEEIMRCESGEGTVVFPEAPGDERERALKAGDIIHFDANTDHSIVNRGAEPASFLVIRLLSEESV